MKLPFWCCIDIVTACLMDTCLRQTECCAGQSEAKLLSYRGALYIHGSWSVVNVAVSHYLDLPTPCDDPHRLRRL